MLERLKKAVKRPTPEEVGPVNFGDPPKEVKRFARAHKAKLRSESDNNLSYLFDWFDDGVMYVVDFNFVADMLVSIRLCYKEELTEEEYNLLKQEKFVPRMWDNIIAHLVDEYDVDFEWYYNQKYPEFSYEIHKGFGPHLQVSVNAVSQNLYRERPCCVYFVFFRWNDF